MIILTITCQGNIINILISVNPPQPMPFFTAQSYFPRHRIDLAVVFFVNNALYNVLWKKNIFWLNRNVCMSVSDTWKYTNDLAPSLKKPLIYIYILAFIIFKDNITFLALNHWTSSINKYVSYLKNIRKFTNVFSKLN